MGCCWRLVLLVGLLVDEPVPSVPCCCLVFWLMSDQGVGVRGEVHEGQVATNCSQHQKASSRKSKKEEMPKWQKITKQIERKRGSKRGGCRHQHHIFGMRQQVINQVHDFEKTQPTVTTITQCSFRAGFSCKKNLANDATAAGPLFKLSLWLQLFVVSWHFYVYSISHLVLFSPQLLGHINNNNKNAIAVASSETVTKRALSIRQKKKRKYVCGTNGRRQRDK